MTCRYQDANPDGIGEGRLYAALAEVVTKHPMLRVGILGEDTNEASFCHLPEMDLRNNVSFTTVPCETADEYEAVVAEQQGWHHNQVWSELATRSPWRVAVLKPSGGYQPQGLQDIIFAYHHALMDGTSGRNFHEELLAALNNQPEHSSESLETPYLLTFESAPTLPEPLDDVIQFKSTLSYVCRQLWAAFAPSWLKSKKHPWGAKVVDMSLPYNTRVLPIDLGPETLESLLKACKSHSTSLTALIQALIAVSLARRLPPSEAVRFASSTPINLRPFVNATADESLKDTLRVLITSLTHKYSATTLREIRAPQADIDALAWKIAGRVKDELNNRLATIPTNDIMGLLKFVSDWFDFWRNQDGLPRHESWEVSNIGILKNSEATTVPTRITRILFTNGAMTAGPPLGIAVGSVVGGGLTIAISWQDGIVEDKLVKELAQDITACTSQLQETGRIC